MKKLIIRIKLSELLKNYVFLSEFVNKINSLENLKKFKIKGYKKDAVEVNLYFENCSKFTSLEPFNFINELINKKNK